MDFFWFFVALSVESSIIPIADVIVEHRLYLPSVGAFITVVTSLFILQDKLAHKKMKVDLAIIPSLSLVVIVFAGATYARNTVWQNEFRLWSDVVEKSPFDARGRYNLGNAYNHEGRVDKAVEQYEGALKLKPNLAEARNDLGNAYSKKGWVDKAIEQYDDALKLKPDYAEARNNLGSAFNDKGWLDKAIEQYEDALKVRPDSAIFHYNLGMTFMRSGLKSKAATELKAALKLKPDFTGPGRALEYMSK